MVAEAMNTDLMGIFLAQVGKAHPEREVVMVLDGASPHRAKGLAVPDNIVNGSVSRPTRRSSTQPRFSGTSFGRSSVQTASSTRLMPSSIKSRKGWQTFRNNMISFLGSLVGRGLWIVFL